MLKPGDALLPLLLISALSNYGLYLSYNNIIRLREYEETSEKAAEWSNKIAERLSKTRSTQTSGTVALLISFLTSTILLFPTSPRMLLTGCLANALALYFSSTHMGSFWNEKEQTRIPFVEKFNEAVRGSEKVVWILGTLSLGWAVTGCVFMAVDKGVVTSATGLAGWVSVVGVRAYYMLQKGWGM